ncbi:MAG: GNAT family N-acetyltransferase [Planctomycetes bacterium]|nr:GNAT family N-acetyltransferase [Planctomycetota bacterium]
MGVNIDIDYLADHPEFILTLAQWHHQEWAYLRPGDTLEARIARLRAEIGHRQIPTTVIAFKEQCLLGSAMLIQHDMDTRMDLSPWLASVFVSPDYRRQGIGAALIERIIQEARALDIYRLYLYTPSAEQFYLQRGWSAVERTRYRNTDVVIMSYKI